MLDVYELCTPDLQEKMVSYRSKFKDLEDKKVNQQPKNVSLLTLSLIHTSEIGVLMRKLEVLKYIIFYIANSLVLSSRYFYSFYENTVFALGRLLDEKHLML